MDFFNKLSQKASETYKGVSEKTNKLTKEAKLRMKMSDNKSKINDLYQEIGKKIYERHASGGEIDIKKELEEEITKIDVLSAEIESCLNEIRLLNDKKQCIKCFAEIEKDARFCNHCGAEQVVDTTTDNTSNVQVENTTDVQNTENSSNTENVENSSTENEVNNDNTEN